MFANNSLDPSIIQIESFFSDKMPNYSFCSVVSLCFSLSCSDIWSIFTDKLFTILKTRMFQNLQYREICKSLSN
jgi:hypothetical protein